MSGEIAHTMQDAVPVDEAGATPCEQGGLYANPQVDAVSGATPGVSTACRDLGMATPEAAAKKFGCKPPGQ